MSSPEGEGLPSGSQYQPMVPVRICGVSGPILRLPRPCGTLDIVPAEDNWCCPKRSSAGRRRRGEGRVFFEKAGRVRISIRDPKVSGFGNSADMVQLAIKGAVGGMSLLTQHEVETGQLSRALSLRASEDGKSVRLIESVERKTGVPHEYQFEITTGELIALIRKHGVLLSKEKRGPVPAKAD